MDLPSGGGPSNTEAALRDLKERVDRVHRASALPVRCGVAPLPSGLPDGSLQSSVARHDLQHQGIVEQMRGGGLLSPELTFVDFGAGDGGLCRCVACAAGGGRYVLVDRSRRPTMPSVGVHEVNWLSALTLALSLSLNLRLSLRLRLALALAVVQALTLALTLTLTR